MKRTYFCVFLLFRCRGERGKVANNGSFVSLCFPRVDILHVGLFPVFWIRIPIQFPLVSGFNYRGTGSLFLFLSLLLALPCRSLSLTLSLTFLFLLFFFFLFSISNSLCTVFLFYSPLLFLFQYISLLPSYPITLSLVLNCNQTPSFTLLSRDVKNYQSRTISFVNPFFSSPLFMTTYRSTVYLILHRTDAMLQLWIAYPSMFCFVCICYLSLSLSQPIIQG